MKTFALLCFRSQRWRIGSMDERLNPRRLIGSNWRIPYVFHLKMDSQRQANDDFLLVNRWSDRLSSKINSSWNECSSWKFQANIQDLVENHHSSATTNYVSLPRFDQKEYGSCASHPPLDLIFCSILSSDELPKISRESKAKRFPMPKVQLSVVYKSSSHAARWPLCKPVKQCTAWQKIWISIVIECH